jgi:hypothetical protein
LWQPGKTHKAISSDAISGGINSRGPLALQSQGNFILPRQFKIRCGHPPTFRIARDNLAAWRREAIAHRPNGQPGIRTSFAPETTSSKRNERDRALAKPL